MNDPQQAVRVWLQGHGEPIDVTSNNVVAALRPFTLGVMFHRAHSADGFDQPLRLSMREQSRAAPLLGTIELHHVRTINLPQHQFCLFETIDCENFCVGPGRLLFYDWLELRKAQARQRKNPYNFRMTPTDLRCSRVFYICPRPVVLVTVEHQGKGNMFPMDLIGPTDSPWYSMALRSTSPAVELMKQSKRMALASVPVSYQAAAYELGKHHRMTSIDWAALPFPTVSSPLFGLPVIEAALRLREVRVEEYHEVGSHVLFVTSIERETLPNSPRSPQLFHRYSSFRRYLTQ
jgi:flavin reductase (DIM6/NTAB) family NADH-FMN oxidoreductase RutF